MNEALRHDNRVYRLGIWAKSDQLRRIKDDSIPIELVEMKKVHLQELSSLRSFSLGDIVEWPSLENVVVRNCPSIKKFGLGKIKQSQLKSVLIIENEVQIDAKVPYLFELDDELSNIIEYNIGDNEELIKKIRNLQPSHFTKLQVLEVKNCNENLRDFLYVLVRRSHKLEVINIEQCKTIYSYLFDTTDAYEERHGDGIYLTQLKELKLTKIDGMEKIWSDDKPETLSLNNLQILHIKDCHFLTHIFSFHQVKKLHQLKELMIEACEALASVLMNTLFRVGPASKFPLLSKLEFKSLPNLSYFYRGDHVQFPSLKYLTIEKCPVLTKFITDAKLFPELNEIVFDSNNTLVYVISSKTLQELRNLKKVFVSHFVIGQTKGISYDKYACGEALAS
ncbi:unnamed protein product [Sphenostylis stenocarpa]|uniref:Disease resistance protein At4g27190-like leucine-rich repeats domain-containing protein n=1 Tax=Sphenostylis stenocarpa TaxID=92480 RepID=A0AA86VSU3_9FABA|nr:unnamed protein product [Sphenostylis stenocarpa]